MDPLDYFLEMPEIEYDASALRSMIPELQWEQWNRPPKPGTDEVGTQYADFYQTYDVKMRESQCVKDIFSQLQETSGLSIRRTKFLHLRHDFKMKIHKDWARPMTVHFPLEDDDAPIVFYNDDHEPVVSHQYRCATAINTSDWHAPAVSISGKDRYAFQITCDLQFQDFVELYKSGKVVQLKTT